MEKASLKVILMLILYKELLLQNASSKIAICFTSVSYSVQNLLINAKYEQKLREYREHEDVAEWTRLNGISHGMCAEL